MELATLTAEATEADIEACLDAMLACERAGGAVEVLTWHAFAPGLVARTVLLEAGTATASVLHKAGHVVVIAGDCTLAGPGMLRRVTGYQVLESLATDEGARRIVTAHADTWITTVHANPDNCTDVDELARRFAGDPEMLQQVRHNLPAAPSMEALQWHGQ